MELVLASRNFGKIREFRQMLKALPSLEIFSLIDFPSYEPREESGSTFQENASIKALHAAQTLRKTVLADDSGLVVPLLKGAPGVFSARYAGEGASDRDNRRKLLEALEGREGLDRSAYFECCLALAVPEGIVKAVSARCEGVITEKERGGQGFGYDPVFLKHDYDKTFAELDDQTKNRVSHRRKALQLILPKLESLAFKTA